MRVRRTGSSEARGLTGRTLEAHAPPAARHLLVSLRTVEDAVAWIERVGIALLFPKPDVVLPSLWEAVAETSEVDWAIRDEAGGYVSVTPEMQRGWSWKDE